MLQSKIQLDSFIHDLSEIPTKDELVSVDFFSKKIVEVNEFPTENFSLPIEGAIKNILKLANDKQKEADINTLCIINKLVTWKKNEQIFHTPLLLFPLQSKINKLKANVQFEISENWEVNPYLKWLWKEWTGNELIEFEKVADLFLFFQQEITSKDLPLEIESRNFIGNFHYHRYHILRELEGIQKAQNFSNPLKQLLGETYDKINTNDFTNRNLVPCDKDQANVLQILKTENCVVEGPPGTGKSQLIINLLAKTLEKKQTVLVVSEKKVALDVLKKKLAAHNLHHFAFSVNSRTSNKEFILALKTSWEFLEQSEEKLPINLLLSENYLSNLQFLLNRLKDKNAFQGIDYGQFVALLRNHPKPPATYSSNVCSLSEWLEIKEKVVQLDTILGGLNSLKNFKALFFSEIKPDLLLESLSTQLIQLKQDFQVNTLNDLERLNSFIGKAQLLENDLYEQYKQFQGKPKLFKQFEKQLHKLQTCNNQLKTLEPELKIWKTVPTLTQLNSWKKTVGYLKKRSAKKAISKAVFDNTISSDLALETLTNYYQLKEELNTIQTYFLSTGFQTNTAILEVEYLFLKQLLAESSDSFTELLKWNKNKRKLLVQSAAPIDKILRQLRTYFEFDFQLDLTTELNQKTNVLTQLLPFWKTIQSLPSSFFQSIRNTTNWNELEQFIVHSNWKIIQSNTPELAKFEAKDFTEKLNQIIKEQAQEFDWFGKKLIHSMRTEFTKFETLLQTSNTKLNTSEKERKKELKKGKTLLVNEFSKLRSHKNIRELLTGEAKEWIRCILPIWLSTPTQVADHFPLEKDLFDWSLFDEASQIPLPNAFGSLYRSKRTLIVGDQQQMSPSSYFGKKYEFPDLMHQSSYYFTSLNLNYHYRSVHPDLICFSNRYFYNNKLTVFPTSNIHQAIFHNYLENGKYIDRKNEVEAREIATFLENFTWKKTLGLVAFSEEQLACILKNCSKKVLDKLEECVDQNRGFVKSLDKVQGDEAEVLVISFAYGKNETGEFTQRFGPVNHADGHKRLNVLFSRAKEEIHFFSSVNSHDFSLSENESINLLRKWFLLLDEQIGRKNEVLFPFHVLYQLNNSNLIVENVSSSIEFANDLLTFHSVLQTRGWKISYT